MQIICSRTDLNNAISMVQRAIASRSTLPILEGILFSAQDKLTLTGYDMETGIEARLPAEIRQGGEVVFKSKIFGDIVRKLPEENVFIQIDDKYKATIKSGQANFEIFAQPGDEYPKLPEVEEKQKLNLPQELLKEMIGQTLFASSTDESRPILNGLKVHYEQGKLEMVAIDGFRLAVRSSDLDDMDDILDFIVPSKAMAEVARALEAGESIAIFPSHNHILFETDKFRLVSRLIEGDFLDYKRIIPPSCNSQITVSTQDMLAAIERAALLINVEQRRFPVSLKTLSSHELQISAKTDLGSVEETIAVDLAGDNIDIDFNPKYFLDALGVIDQAKVVLEFSGSSAPCLIKPLEGEDFLYMVLPLRR